MTLMSKIRCIFVHDEFIHGHRGSFTLGRDRDFETKLGEWYSGTTHNLAVIWPDYASMQSSLTANAMSQTWSAFISSIGNAATQVGIACLPRLGCPQKRLSCNST